MFTGAREDDEEESKCSRGTFDPRKRTNEKRFRF